MKRFTKFVAVAAIAAGIAISGMASAGAASTGVQIVADDDCCNN